MKKTYTKNFAHKGQMINYYNKMMITNRWNFESIYNGYDTETKSYFITYSYL